MFNRTLVLFLLFTFKTYAEVPNLFNYSGRILTDDDIPRTDGTYEIAFEFWDSPLNGDLLWGREIEVTLIDGYLNAILGNESGNSISGARFNRLSDVFREKNTYISLSILKLPDGSEPSQDSEILPRQQILSTAYAFQAERADNGVPAGCLQAYAGETAPDGWMLCDGSAIDSATYPDLYEIIGEKWGDGGDGVGGLFNLPDLRGRTPIGAGQGEGLSNRRVAETGGAEQHTLTIEEMPSHSHEHTDNYAHNRNRGDDGQGPGVRWNSSQILETKATGGNAPHNNMQPYAVLYYIIKT